MKLSFTVPLLAAAFLVGLEFWTSVPSPRVLAQPAGGGEAKAASKRFEVDTTASHVYVRVDPDGRGHAHGVVGQLASGSVALGASQMAGELAFDLTSFTADAPEVRKYVGVEAKMSDSDRRSVTRTMLGSQVLNTRQYPKATYSITSVTPLDGQAAGLPGRYRFEGRLSLHGAEQPLRFEAKAEASGTEGSLQMRGQFSLKQTDYKMKPYSALYGALQVKDQLTIHGDLLLHVKGSK